jgi:hypothetical protein
MVSDGKNQFGTFAHESQAVKMVIDRFRLRKPIQNKAKLEQECEEACFKIKIKTKPSNHYFVSQRTDNTLVTDDSYQILSDALLDVKDELDVALRDVRGETVVYNSAMTDRE